MECHFDRLNWFVVSKDVPKTCMCILRFLREHEHTCDFENMVVSIDCTSATLQCPRELFIQPPSRFDVVAVSFAMAAVPILPSVSCQCVKACFGL